MLLSINPSKTNEVMPVVDANAVPEIETLPAMPVPDLVSMTRALTRVRNALGVSQERAAAAVSSRLVGGVLPDVSLAQLEALAAAGDARVCVMIRTEDGRSLDLAHLL
jgi:hypothetical protein